MNPAAHSRKEKELHPERYCATKNCLWNINRSPCMNHPIKTDPPDTLRCMNCGRYKSDWDDEGGSCEVMESGEGNSASPSGAYPVPFNRGIHVFVSAEYPHPASCASCGDAVEHDDDSVKGWDEDHQFGLCYQCQPSGRNHQTTTYRGR